METEEKKVEGVVDGEQKTAQSTPKMRQIVIETDGNDIKLIKAEVSGKIELVAIFQFLINYINKQ